MVTARRLAIGVPLLVISGIAGQVISGTKLTGNMVAAYWNSSSYSSYGYIDVTPTDTPDGAAYSVHWSGCTFHPDFDHRYCMFAAGMAPRSAVKMQADRMEIQLDVSMLSVVYFKNGDDCRSGTCFPFTPLSVPLNGAFTIYRGPNWYVEESHGSSSRESSVYTITFHEWFNGTRIRYSANFAGLVGPLTVTPPPSGSNSSVTVMKGQGTYRVVY